MKLELKTAQELIKANSSVCSGFNTFIQGGNEPKYPDFGDKSEWHAQLQGYQFAKKMAVEDGIAFTHIFKCGKTDSCFPFEFGGFFVCNSCDRKGVDKDWWKIQVEKYRNAYCCHGLDFKDLQSSENYAFGNTFNEAIKNYGELMIQM